MIHEGFKNNPEIFFKGTLPWKWLRYFTPHSLTALQRCHFWHFWCVKAAVIDIDIGSVPAESRQWTSHSFACQVGSWRSSRPVISPKWFYSCQEISEQNLAGWRKMRRLTIVFSETADFSSAFSWAQFHFLIPAVCITLRLKIMCRDDLTPAQHSKQHDSMSYNGSCYVNYAPPFNPFCPPNIPAIL